MRLRKILILSVGLLLSAKVALAEGNIFSPYLKNYQLAGWKIDFGIDERLRNEYKENADFNDNKKDKGNLIYNRIRINGKATLAQKYEIFLEGMDLRVGNWHLKKPAQEDNFDLHQAYFRMNNIAGLHFDFKIGRQELAYGKGRLIWASTWSNRINHFDAVVLRYKNKGFYADLFSGLKVGYDTNHFNRPTTHELLAGLYGGYRKDKDSPLIEAYFLANTDAKDPQNLRRYTLGLRTQARVWQDLVFDFEMPYQFGNDRDKEISAYALHFDASKGFDLFWQPRITLTYNLASGDEKLGDKKTNSFVPLYHSTHDPFGLMDFFRWQNMHEAAIEVSLSPHKKLKIIPATSFFWLYSNLDSWYDSSGNKLRTNTTGDPALYVGQEASIRAQYELNNYVKLESGYAHFFSGPYVKDTGPNDDADWAYIQLNVKI